MKIGSRVILRDVWMDPGEIVGFRRSDDLFASGRLRSRGSKIALVDWQNGKRPTEHFVDELVDVEAEDSDA